MGALACFATQHAPGTHRQFHWKPDRHSWRIPPQPPPCALSPFPTQRAGFTPEVQCQSCHSRALNRLGVWDLATTFHWFLLAAVRRGKASFSPIRIFGAGVLNDPLNVTGEKNGQSLNLAWAGPWQQGKNLIECGGFKRQETWWPFPVFWRADSIALLKMLIPNGSLQNRSSEKALGMSYKRVEDNHRQCVFRGHCVKFSGLKPCVMWNWVHSL